MNMKQTSDQTFFACVGGVLTCGCDAEGTILWADPGFYNMLNYTESEFAEKFQNKIAPVIISEESENGWKKFCGKLSDKKVLLAEYRLQCKSGDIKWVVFSSRLMEEEGKEPYSLIFYHDISVRKKRQISVQEQILKDPLTGLYNKKAAESMIQEYLESSSEAAALFVIDIDNFKGINDNFGHIYGDSVLTEMSRHLKSITRSTDIVGRVGGDEFIAFFTDIKGKEGIIRKAKDIGKMFYRSFEDSDIHYEISGSIGISFFPDDGTTYLELFEKADVAAYFSKDNGKNQYTVYQENMEHRSLQTADSGQEEQDNQLALYRKASRGGTFQVRMDENYTLFYGNDIYYQIMGYTKQEMKERLGNQCRRNIYPGDVNRVEDLIRRASYSGQHVLEWEMRIVTGQGEIRWIWVNGALEYRSTGCVMSGFILDTTERHDLLSQISRSEERYRIALQQTHMNVWEYDIPNRRLILTESAREHHGFGEIIENVPEYLIESGHIHPDSVKEVREMYRKIREGEPKAEAEIRTRNPGGNGWWWEKVVYTSIFDEDGLPQCAIAVGEDITGKKEAEINYQKELQMRFAMSEGILASSRANLTKNCVEYLQSEILDIEGNEGAVNYDDLVKQGLARIVNSEDRVRYLRIMSSDALISAYVKGQSQVSLEYRWLDLDEKLIWICTSVSLVKDAVTQDLYAYGKMRDIDYQKKLELGLKQRAEKDNLTGAYHKETAFSIMNAAIRNARSLGHDFAVILFSVDNFRRIDRCCGYGEGGNVLKELSSLLDMKFGSRYLAGRYSEDELLLLVPGPKQQRDLPYKTEDVRQSVRMSYVFSELEVPVTVSAGIAVSGDGIKNIQEGCGKAKEALDAAKERGGDCCVMYSQVMAAEKNLVIQELKDTGRENAEEAGPEKEEDVLLKCVYSLTSSMDFEQVLEEILRELGTYFRAEHTYILILGDDMERTEYLKEWRRDGIPTKSSIPFELLQQIKNQMAVTDIGEIAGIYPEEAEILREQGISSFQVVSMDKVHNGIAGYIGVENGARHMERTTVLHSVRHFVGYEIMRRRLHEKQEYLSYHDALTGLENRNSYLAYRDGLSEDTLISLGVVSADINGLKQLNTQYGHDYGDYMVKFTGRVMREKFKGGRIFRFAGDEFLAVFENLSQKAFLDCVEDMRAAMEASYPSSISLGAVWTDTEMNLEHAITRADERMLLAKQEYYRSSQNIAKHYDPAMLKKLLKDIQDGRFRMFLQPKAEISTCRIVGAEALVRYADSDGKIVGPAQFIPQLEQAGNVRHVDMYIFEEVCRALKSWKDKGYACIPVSLNFSRTTLLEEGLIDKIEEIYQRYQVDRNLIEIEVTESASVGERETIVAISGKLASLGYRIALDDFGAKYSNMSILSAMELEVLKLDRSLVSDLFSNEKTRVVVKNFLQTCRQLGIQSVAEGVESREQLEVLEVLGCDYAQGYYFNKPIPLEKFEEVYLKNSSCGEYLKIHS
ncbi:diguanylate cyclase [Lactonifactor longoviformis]|uniref:diguanylate cyclase n=1 Tax=Lactonifactor longoviformis TaxID=341220 RepID=UPI0036F1ABA6